MTSRPDRRMGYTPSTWRKTLSSRGLPKPFFVDRSGVLWSIANRGCNPVFDAFLRDSIVHSFWGSGAYAGIYLQHFRALPAFP